MTTEDTWQRHSFHVSRERFGKLWADIAALFTPTGSSDQA
jgi:hypothetical protein